MILPRLLCALVLTVPLSLSAVDEAQLDQAVTKGLAALAELQGEEFTEGTFAQAFTHIRDLLITNSLSLFLEVIFFCFFCSFSFSTL